MPTDNKPEPRVRPGKALRRVVEEAPRVFARMPLTRSRCVFATAVGVEALRELGVAAEPASVRTVLFNAAMRAWLEEGSPGGEEEAIRRGGYVLETEKNDADPIDWTAGRWRGHLVVRAAGHLVDLDLQQMNRPQRGIRVPDAAAFAWPEGSERRSYELPGGLLLGYELLPADRSFELVGDWRLDKPEKREAVAALVRAARGR